MNKVVRTALLLGAAVLASCDGTAEPAADGPASARPEESAVAPPEESAVPAPQEFSVRVTTDRATYEEGEEVKFTVEICNQGAATTTEGGGGSDIPFSHQFLDERDAVVADDSHAVRTMELRIVRWAEGQCRTAQGSWDQHFWNRAEDRPSEPPEVYGLPQRGAVVPRGEYRIRVSSRQGTTTSEPFELRSS